MNKESLVHGEWEYHPSYGTYSRLVYKKLSGDGGYEFVRREYTSQLLHSQYPISA